MSGLLSRVGTSATTMGWEDWFLQYAPAPRAHAGNLPTFPGLGGLTPENCIVLKYTGRNRVPTGGRDKATTATLKTDREAHLLTEWEVHEDGLFPAVLATSLELYKDEERGGTHRFIVIPLGTPVSGSITSERDGWPAGSKTTLAGVGMLMVNATSRFASDDMGHVPRLDVKNLVNGWANAMRTVFFAFASEMQSGRADNEPRLKKLLYCCAGLARVIQNWLDKCPVARSTMDEFVKMSGTRDMGWEAPFKILFGGDGADIDDTFVANALCTTLQRAGKRKLKGVTLLEFIGVYNTVLLPAVLKTFLAGEITTFAKIWAAYETKLRAVQTFVLANAVALVDTVQNLRSAAKVYAKSHRCKPPASFQEAEATAFTTSNVAIMAKICEVADILSPDEAGYVASFALDPTNKDVPFDYDAMQVALGRATTAMPFELRYDTVVLPKSAPNVVTKTPFIGGADGEEFKESTAIAVRNAAKAEDWWGVELPRPSEGEVIFKIEMRKPSGVTWLAANGATTAGAKAPNARISGGIVQGRSAKPGYTVDGFGIMGKACVGGNYSNCTPLPHTWRDRKDTHGYTFSVALKKEGPARILDHTGKIWQTLDVQRVTVGARYMSEMRVERAVVAPFVAPPSLAAARAVAAGGAGGAAGGAGGPVGDETEPRKLLTPSEIQAQLANIGASLL